MTGKVALAALLALCFLLILTLYGVMHDTPDPNDRTVAVLRSESGCVLILHRVKHDLAREQCRNVARALLQVAGPLP